MLLKNAWVWASWNFISRAVLLIFTRASLRTNRNVSTIYQLRFNSSTLKRRTRDIGEVVKDEKTREYTVLTEKKKRKPGTKIFGSADGIKQVTTSYLPPTDICVGDIPVIVSGVSQLGILLHQLKCHAPD